MIKQSIDELKFNSDKKFNLSVLWLLVILFIYCYFGTFSFFEKAFPNINNLDYWKIIYHNTSSFVLFFVGGIIFTKFVVKDNLSNYGLGKGNYRLGLLLCVIALVIAPICGLLSSFDLDMTSTYPLISFDKYNSWQFITLYILSYLLYYIGWEYLFRGIGIFGTKEKCGILGAIIFTTLISALIHTSIADFGKPLMETLSAIPAGLIFGFISFKTKSIWYTVFIHFAIGIATDLFIYLL